MQGSDAAGLQGWLLRAAWHEILTSSSPTGSIREPL